MAKLSTNIRVLLEELNETASISLTKKKTYYDENVRKMTQPFIINNHFATRNIFLYPYKWIESHLSPSKQAILSRLKSNFITNLKEL